MAFYYSKYTPFILSLSPKSGLIILARGGMQFRAAAYGSEVRLAATDFQGFPSAQIKFVRAALCFKDKVQLFHAVNLDKKIKNSFLAQKLEKKRREQKCTVKPRNDSFFIAPLLG